MSPETTEPTTKERTAFAFSKVANAFKWYAISGTASFFLSGLLDIFAQIELPTWVVLVMTLVINTLIFGIAKYTEGSDK